MRLVRAMLDRARTEEGGVSVIAAIFICAFALIASGGLQVGNWYMHRRHLQLQTDAAAFAAGQRFALCASPAQDTARAEMEGVADQFGGFTADAFNQQFGTGTGFSGSIARVYNQNDYPIGSVHERDPVPDPIPADPCTEPQMFDVKATENTIPRIFSFLPLGQVNAHSRIELKAINEMRGLLPLAVPDVRPTRVFAQLINSAGTQIDEVELLKGGSAANAQIWESNARSFSIPADDITVRIKLVGSNQDPATLTCGVLYTECYDTVHIRGWNAAAATPRAEDVWILAGTCLPDAYYAEDDCSAGLQADIDLGSANPVTASTRVWATVDGRGEYELAPETTGTGVIRWTATSGLPLNDGPRNYVIALGWTPGTGRDRSLGNVHTGVVSAPGPIKLVQVVDGGGAGANSFSQGTADFVIRIQTLGALLLSQPTDKPLYLRVFNDSGSASQNQTLNCDRDAANLAEELELGCQPYFIKNPSLTCPGGSAANLWSIWYDNGEPLPCVLIRTGASVGQITRGLNMRIYGDANPGAGACASSPVNWIRNVGFDGDANPGDKRALPLIVTPLGTFQGRGGDQVPVIDFGYFYVTGYKGDPCEGVDPNQDPVPNNRGAYVRGHFVKFFPLDDVVPSDELCKFDSITPCVGVLTR